MSTIKYVRNFSALLLAALLFPDVGIAKSVDVKFDLLQTRTDVYTNVTVTTVMPAFICFQHLGGIGTIKVADLLDDALIRLEYKAAPKKDSGDSLGAQVSVQMKKTFSRFDFSALAPLIGALKETAKKGIMADTQGRNIILVALGILLVFQLFFCFCAKLICEKTGNKPGVLIWLPILQFFPLLKAAGMSPAWFLAFLLPVLNFIAGIVWAVKITRARGKHGFIALLLLLPVTNLFAFLYLAFSKGAPPKEDDKPSTKREPVMMTLEAA